jgi:hypothetical protein
MPQRALVNSVINLWVPQNVGKILEKLSNWWFLKDSDPWSE